MSPSEKEAKKERANSEASADNKAEAITLSLEEMTAMAKKLRRHVISMVGKAGSGHPDCVRQHLCRICS